MTFALVMIALTIALLAVFVVATEVHEIVNPVLTHETTIVGLSDPAADTLAGQHNATPAPAGDWQIRTVAGLRDAEELMDSLEAQGYKERELVMLGKASFAVRWR